MTRLAWSMLALGVLGGWLTGRNVGNLLTPRPELIYLSPRVQCGGPHEVDVPMAENVRWGVQTGSRWWQPDKGTWGLSPQWRTGPGKLVIPPSPAGVRLVVEGFKSGNVAGTLIRGVKVEPEKEKKP